MRTIAHLAGLLYYFALLAAAIALPFSLVWLIAPWAARWGGGRAEKLLIAAGIAFLLLCAAVWQHPFDFARGVAWQRWP